MKVQNKSVPPGETVAIIAFLINPYYAIIYDNFAKSQKALERGLRGREPWFRLKDKSPLCTPFNTTRRP
jgi:hypothetical protein